MRKIDLGELMNKEKFLKGLLAGVLSLLLTSVGFNINGVVSADGTVDVSKLVKAEIKEVVVEAVNEEVPAMLEGMKTDITTLKDDVSAIKKGDEEAITAKALGAYDKIFTVEDLKNNPTNRFNILMGLKLESCRNLLLIYDRERTLMFEEYLINDQ